ncbi:MAG: hypothetical protein MUQ10_07430 [Anaerolineae bacterium]|nr:hypothetical protein [Anaerolineae bacterium]
MKPKQPVTSVIVRDLMEIEAARKDYKGDAALLESRVATGLRASEAAGLTAGDVELNERSGWVSARGKPCLLGESLCPQGFCIRHWVG